MSTVFRDSFITAVNVSLLSSFRKLHVNNEMYTA